MVNDDKNDSSKHIFMVQYLWNRNAMFHKFYWFREFKNSPYRYLCHLGPGDGQLPDEAEVDLVVVVEGHFPGQSLGIAPEEFPAPVQTIDRKVFEQGPHFVHEIFLKLVPGEAQAVREGLCLGQHGQEGLHDRGLDKAST